MKDNWKAKKYLDKAIEDLKQAEAYMDPSLQKDSVEICLKIYELRKQID